MKMFISGLFNRGKENEYVELEAAAKCSLEGLMLLRYHYGKNGLPVQRDTRVFAFPDINLRKGNLVRLYTFHHNGQKKEKDQTLGKTAFNFSWDLDQTIWAGSGIEARIMQEGNGMGLYPDDPLADTPRQEDSFSKTCADDRSFAFNMMLSALEGNFNVIGKDGTEKPVTVINVPAEVKAALEAKDYEKVYALMLEESAK